MCPAKANRTLAKDIHIVTSLGRSIVNVAKKLKLCLWSIFLQGVLVDLCVAGKAIYKSFSIKNPLSV